MKTLLVADPHLGLSGPESEFERKRSGAVVKFFLETVEEYEPRKVVILGDLPRRSRRLSYRGVGRITDMLSALTWNWTELVIVLGNHDISEEYSLVKAFQFGFGATAIWFPQWVGMNEYVLPWGMTVKEIESKLDELEEGKYSDIIIYTHIGVAGGVTGSDFVLQGDIDPGIFDRKIIKKVYAGHYHKRQKVGKVQYIGSPYQVTFGEEGDDKFVLLLDDEKELWIPTPSYVPQLVTATAEDVINAKEEYRKDKYFRIIYLKEEEKEEVWGLPGYGDEFFVHSFTKEEKEKVEKVSKFRQKDFELQPEEVVKDYADEQGFDEGVTEVGIDIVRTAIKEGKGKDE